MSSKYVREDTFPIMAPVLTAQAVAIGDMVGLSSGNVVRAEDTAFASAIATPTAPTVTNSAVAQGTSLTNAATGVKISYNFPWGEGPLSAAGSGTPTAAATLIVTYTAAASPALSTNIYVETAAASGVYKLHSIQTGGTVIVGAYGAGPVPNSGTSAALDVTQYNFVQTFLGMSSQRKDAAVARVPGNGEDNVIRVDTQSICEFDTASASYNVGDLVGPAKQTGSLLESQKVVAVTSEVLAVGRVSEKTTSSTKVRVNIMSKMLPGSRQKA